jgi:hypothetical protein
MLRLNLAAARKAVPPDATIAVGCFNSSSVHPLFRALMESIPIHPLLSQFERWLGSQGSIYSFASPEISDNRVEQRLVDIQFGLNSSGRFQIVGSDVMGFANYINRDRIYEHGQDLRGQY